ncbi:hypothetical protein CALCODRAFT_483747 [Calocera cornea HHB12733]|uniref:Uncharacterized protein n=1 Tax=Calocera cornea HHB12733 TaxID=1353952 RepID=A0A165FH88_9BASI|nr:hypothetical protein CALCODRAFT_483747 [Calocera cornea HHB12733]
MSSHLLALAHPEVLAAQSQSQADIAHQQQVLADYLAKSALDEEEEEAAFSDEEGPEEVDVVMHQDGELEKDEDEEDADGADGDVDLEAVLSAHLGGSGWEKKSKEELHGAFIALREDLYDLELQLATASGYLPRWGPSEAEEDEAGEDDSAAHLAGWLGKMTPTELAQATREDVLWWLVDMCKVLDGLRKMVRYDPVVALNMHA